MSNGQTRLTLTASTLMLLASTAIAAPTADPNDPSGRIPGADMGKAPVKMVHEGSDSLTDHALHTVLAQDAPVGDMDVVVARSGQAQSGLKDAPGSMQIELAASATEADRNLASQAEQLWSQDRYDESRELIEKLKANGSFVGAGVSWYESRGIIIIPFLDRRIGGSREGSTGVSLDRVNNSSTLYAVVGWPDGWSLNRSTNNGSTWTETYFWSGIGGVESVDLAVAGDFVYIGYVWDGDTTDMRVRRASAATGAIDGSYGFESLGDDALNDYEEIAVESNQDFFNNRIYVAGRNAAGDINYFWDVSTDGESFESVSTGIINAASGPDLHWNQNYDDYFLFMGYITNAGEVMAGRIDNTWELLSVGTNVTLPTVREVRVSAHDETVIVAYESQVVDDTEYHISYNSGDSWLAGTAGNNAGSNLSIDTTVRDGIGAAIVTGVEIGEPDDVTLRFRPALTPGEWGVNRDVNFFDVSTGTEVTVQAIEPTDAEDIYAYGVIFQSGGGIPYFRYVAGCAGDVNFDGSIDLADLNIVLANFGFGTTPGRSGDANFDGSVDLADLNLILASFGSNC